MLPPSYSCPSCKCHALYRTRRRGLGWLMSAFGFRPARCYTCGKRCYVLVRRTRAKRHVQEKPAAVPAAPSPKRLKLYFD
jgi:hypothetical protein